MLRVLSAPIEIGLTVDEAKAHLRVDDNRSSAR